MLQELVYLTTGTDKLVISLYTCQQARLHVVLEQ